MFKICETVKRKRSNLLNMIQDLLPRERRLATFSIYSMASSPILQIFCLQVTRKLGLQLKTGIKKLYR